MSRIFSVLFLLVFLNPAFCQFEMLSIPDSIINQANEVVISSDTRFLVKDRRKSRLERSYCVMVLNKYAQFGDDVLLRYNKFSEVDKVVVNVYDHSGKRTKRYRLSDFEDWTGDMSSTASDSRAKVLRLHQNNYPYFIEVDYKIDYDGSLHLPMWIPQGVDKLGLLSASLTIECPDADLLNFKTKNILPATCTEFDGVYKYEWKVSSRPPFKVEKFSGSFDEYVPVVYCSFNEFEIDGCVGKMSSWKEFGAWVYTMNQSRNNLTDEQLSEIRQLTHVAISDLEKAKIVYQYVQDNMHYVSIQLGIGGWVPFMTGFVHENKYGDCKALSFYTHSLLEAVGVKSFYTLIRAGSDELAYKIPEDFPNAFFNHAIVTVLCESDTLWLECTSQTNPFAYMGSFTSDRNALMVSEEGGELVRTKSYSAIENNQSDNIYIELNNDGTAIANLNREVSGVQIENNGFLKMLNKQPSEQKKWLYDLLDWGGISVDTFNLLPVTGSEVPHCGFEASNQVQRAASLMGGRLFFKPGQFYEGISFELADKKRVRPIVVQNPFSQADNLWIKYPEGYEIEKDLKEIDLESSFGHYKRRLLKKEDHCLLEREFVLKKGVYPVEAYHEMRLFIRKCQKYDRQKMVFNIKK